MIKAPSTATMLWMGGSSAPGRSYADLIASGTNWFVEGGASVLKVYDSDLAYLPEATLKSLIAYLKANNIKLAVESYLATARPGQTGEGLQTSGFTQQWVSRVQKFGGTVDYVQMDEALYRGNIVYGRSLNDLAVDVAANVAIIRKAFSGVQIGDIEPFQSGDTRGMALVQNWLAAYKAATGTAIDSFIPDLAYNAQSAAQLLSSLELLSSSLHAQGTHLGILYTGDETDGSNAAWGGSVERHFAAITADPKILIDYAVIQTWQAFPIAATQTNVVGTMVNVAAEYTALAPLYASGAISPQVTTSFAIGAPVWATVPVGQNTSVSGIAVSLGLADITAQSRIAVVLIDAIGLLSANASGKGTVTGSGTNHLVLNGSMVEVNAELASLKILSNIAGSDLLDIETFGGAGRIGYTTTLLTFTIPSANSGGFTPMLPAVSTVITPVLRLAPGSDTGAPGDGITSIHSPTLIGTAAAGTTVTLRADGFLFGTAAVSSTGNWSYVMQAALLDGAHVITAVDGNQAGYTSGTTALALTVASSVAAPTISFASGADSGAPGDFITAVARPRLLGIATYGTTLSIRLDGIIVGTATAAANSTWSWMPSSNLVLGAHTFSVTASNTAGAVSLSANLSLTVVSNNQETINNTSVNDPLFDAAWYMAQHPNVASTAAAAYQQFLSTGWKQGWDPDPWFSVSYYLNQNLDVLQSGLNPLVHFEIFGWKEGRNPSVNFNTRAYVVANPQDAGKDPLAAFIQASEAGQNRIISAATPVYSSSDLFLDPAWYYSQHSDVAATGMNPYLHYTTIGWRLSYDPNPWFDTSYYVSHYKLSTADPLTDYETAGWKLGRNPSAQFDNYQYLANNPDVAAAKINPLEHYLIYGQKEGRSTYLVAPDVALADASDTGMKGDKVTANRQPILVGCGAPGAVVSLTLDGTILGLVTVAVDGNWTYAILSQLNEGQHTVLASEALAAGGSASPSTTFLLTIDTVVPAAPSATLVNDSGIQGDRITNNRSPMLSGSGGAGDTITVIADGALLGTTTASAAGGWTYVATAALADGAHTIKIYDTDRASNISSGTILGITVLTTPPPSPTVRLVMASDTGMPGDNITTALTPRILGTAKADSTIAVNLDSQSMGSVIVDGSGNWIWSVPVNLKVGVHTINAIDYDVAGNASPSVDLAITVVSAVQEKSNNAATTDPLFNAAWYMAQHPEAASTATAAYQQFMTKGWKLGWDPSPYFSTGFYLTQYTDVAKSGMNPLTHFELSGWKEGRDPSAAFNTLAYIAANPADAGKDPLVAYVQANELGLSNRLTFVASETSDPLVNSAYYFNQHPDVAAAGKGAYSDFMNRGAQLGYKPNLYFDPAYYIAHYALTVSSNPLIDFEVVGWKLGNDPSAEFSTNKYLTQNPDVARAGIDPLMHFLVSGQAEGRVAFHT